MSTAIFSGFPRQQLSYKQKGHKWGKDCVDFADAKGTLMNCSTVKSSVMHKRINYDLVNLKLHTEDILYVLNPNELKASFIPDKLQHYPTINQFLTLLQGEAISRPFDWHVIVTNPNAISEIENRKKEAVFQSLQALVQSQSISEEDYQKRLNEQDAFFKFEYQDMHEVCANELLKHYNKKYDFHNLFDIEGIMDALACKEEHYRIDIEGGEPTIERLDPIKLRVFRSGSSNRTEDADMLVYEDFKSIGWVYDTYYDVLSKKDCKYLESIVSGSTGGDGVDLWDEKNAYMDPQVGNDMVRDPHFFSSLLDEYGYTPTMMPYDGEGNVRVLRVYWKSRRMIKKVKKYDPITGEEEFHFYPETYIPNKVLGEEEEIFWVNEAWEGTKIGTDVYVNIRPRPIQYNSMSNPSCCHFGIIGQLYNIGSANSPSMVDILKRYAYLFDATMDKLYKLLESNLGKLVEMDFAFTPDSWKMDKLLHFAKVNHLWVKNSFNEGKKGNATGKIAGSLNNNSTGIIDASVTQEIQFNIQLLDWLYNQMGKACGITPQRLGQVSNRETVGGVERATLQSSHITEPVFARHDNLKKRAIECFVNTSKIALKGRKKVFEYITSDGARKLMEIDGDWYNECDYGLLVDNSQGLLKLNQRLDNLAEMAVQSQKYNFSTIMKIYTTESIAEKIRMMEAAERRQEEMQQQNQQQQYQLEQEKIESDAQQKQLELEQKDTQNQRDNETRLLVAQIQAQANIDSSVARASGFTDNPETPISEKDRLELQQQLQERQEKNRLEHEKLQLEREKIKSQERIARSKSAS